MASGNQVTTDLQSQQQHASDSTSDSTDEDRATDFQHARAITSDSTDEDKAVECVYPSKFYQ